ncbi:AI-2E family transporter [Bacillus sp. T33-2]|uniref:AI-2E family transporter n=1 Tax=Bacillus sp. T33-2 TaxID=2054168 RepID=UPI000C7801F3|nr:AI-2E family transporter [Bacillus sp. T33-2]PLR95225.1 AI-2E family transporter [Bacillus sp. T33-2]
MWIHKPFFKYAAGAILLLVIIFLLGKIDYLVGPLHKFIAAIFFPVLIAGLFYYILRPVVRLLANRIPRVPAILIVFAAVAGLFLTLFYFAGSMIGEQLSDLSKNFPEKVEKISSESKEVINKNDMGIISAEKIEDRSLSYFRSMSEKLSGNVVNIVSGITSVATVLVVVPFLLFFFLKDEGHLRLYILKLIPSEHEDEGGKILSDIDKTLFTYVTGQFIIALVDGVLMYIGYLIIGLDFALILALFAMSLTIVPFFGPLIGVIPAIFVALLHSPMMVLKVLIVLVVVQQLEGNLVTPNVMGKRLHIHPVTVILLLIAAGSLYGFIGILIAIPLYSVLKAIIKNVRKFYLLRYRKV